MKPKPDIPTGPVGRPDKQHDGPMFMWTGGEGELRDESKPVGYDSQGRPLYAPRGRLFRLW
jgi:hypothetical protein